MGLFGPDWSWEEWQKKEEVYNELNKQTDRVVNAINKSNSNADYGRRQREKTERLQERADAINAYVNSLDDKDKAAISRITNEASGIDADTFKAFMIMGKPLSGWLQHHHQNWQIRDWLCLASWIVLIVSFFVAPGFGIIPIIYLLGLYRIVWYIVPAIYSYKKIRKTDCYKGLLEKLKKEDFSKIHFIGAGAESIRIIYVDDKRKKDIRYDEFNFPNLPYDKTAVLLASLLRELGVYKKFGLRITAGINNSWLYLFLFWRGDYTNCREVKSAVVLDSFMFSEEEQKRGGLVVYNYSVYAINKELEKEILKKSKVKSRNDSELLKKAKKEGKTW